MEPTRPKAFVDFLRRHPTAPPALADWCEDYFERHPRDAKKYPQLRLLLQTSLRTPHELACGEDGLVPARPRKDSLRKEASETLVFSDFCTALSPVTPDSDPEIDAAYRRVAQNVLPEGKKIPPLYAMQMDLPAAYYLQYANTREDAILVSRNILADAASRESTFAHELRHVAQTQGTFRQPLDILPWEMEADATGIRHSLNAESYEKKMLGYDKEVAGYEDFSKRFMTEMVQWIAHDTGRIPPGTAPYSHTSIAALQNVYAYAFVPLSPTASQTTERRKEAIRLSREEQTGWAESHLERAERTPSANRGWEK